MQILIYILGAELHLCTVADSTAEGEAEMAAELGQILPEMRPDVQQDLPPSPCPAQTGHPGPCLKAKHLRRGRTFHFTIAQATPGRGGEAWELWLAGCPQKGEMGLQNRSHWMGAF